MDRCQGVYRRRDGVREFLQRLGAVQRTKGTRGRDLGSAKIHHESAKGHESARGHEREKDLESAKAPNGEGQAMLKSTVKTTHLTLFPSSRLACTSPDLLRVKVLRADQQRTGPEEVRHAPPAQARARSLQGLEGPCSPYFRCPEWPRTTSPSDASTSAFARWRGGGTSLARTPMSADCAREGGDAG